MASAAAVAVDRAISPVGNDVQESNGVTSALGPKPDEEEVTGLEDDEDEDIQKRVRRGDRALNPARDDDDEDEAGPGVDDLFGDEDDLPDNPLSKRNLDDAELDSGDDEGRADRVAAEEEEQVMEVPKQVVDMEMPRQSLPEPSDGEMYLLKMPTFMALAPRAWQTVDFQPPTTDHHSRGTPSATFSAYNTAMTTVRWRHSPSNPEQLQSNARINRWSDGSLTLQLASDPTTQYEITGNALAPPQRNPIKPTPTSVPTTTHKAGGRQGISASQPAEKYDHTKDAFTYLVCPVMGSESLRITHKLTAGLSISQSANVVDDAIERLQNSLAAASNASKVQGADGVQMMRIDEDPEIARKRAEVAARETERTRRKQEAAADRERERDNRTMARRGVPSNRYGGAGGLNANMLEDEEAGGAGGSGRRGAGAGKPRARRARKANSEYSSDEDYGRRGFQSKEDDYDQEDDFLAPSDEEEEGPEEDDEDIDDGIVEAPRQRKEKERTPKRDRQVEAPGEEDAEGEDEDVPAATRVKKRRVIDEDDDEE